MFLRICGGAGGQIRKGKSICSCRVKEAEALQVLAEVWAGDKAGSLRADEPHCCLEGLREALRSFPEGRQQQWISGGFQQTCRPVHEARSLGFDSEG